MWLSPLYRLSVPSTGAENRLLSPSAQLLSARRFFLDTSSPKHLAYSQENETPAYYNRSVTWYFDLRVVRLRRANDGEACISLVYRGIVFLAFRKLSLVSSALRLRISVGSNSHSPIGGLPSSAAKNQVVLVCPNILYMARNYTQMTKLSARSLKDYYVCLITEWFKQI